MPDLRSLRWQFRWAALAWRGARGGEPRLTYACRLPAADEVAAGGLVKLRDLAAAWPERGAEANLLYAVSSVRAPGLGGLLPLARRRGLRFVWNQNGVAYPAWCGDRHEAINRPLRRMLLGADLVLYQSRFCREAADRFLGPRTGPSEILPNAVDVDRFRPVAAPERPTLLTAGTAMVRYRFERAAHAFALARESCRDLRWVVAGALRWGPRAEEEAEALLGALGLRAHVERVPPYSAQAAPAVYGLGSVYLHAQCNDNCPSTVLEAMACGLPVVHFRSGGTGELVGGAGVGIEDGSDFEQIRPPAPEPIAAGILEALRRREDLGRLARARAAAEFPLSRWLERHAAIFSSLAGGAP